MPISPGFVRAELVDAPFQINTWALLALPAGNAVVDVRKAANLAAFRAGTYASVCAGAKPTIVTANNGLAQGDALTLWTGEAKFEAGEVVVYVVESCDAGIAWLAPRLLTRRT